MIVHRFLISFAAYADSCHSRTAIAKYYCTSRDGEIEVLRSRNYKNPVVAQVILV